MLVGARYYDPAVGLFITRDTLLSQPPYQYCNDDPINKVDPSGHFTGGAIGGVIGYIGGGIIGGVIAGVLGGPEAIPIGVYWGGGIGAGIGTGIGEYYTGTPPIDAIGDGAIGTGIGFILPKPIEGAAGSIVGSRLTEEQLEELAAYLTRMFNNRPPFQ